MNGEMRNDVDLLIQLFDEAPIVQDRVTGHPVAFSRKVVSYWTGLSIQTVSDYATGKINIPISFWRSILQRFFEPRIVVLLLPAEDYLCEIVPLTIQPDTSKGFFRRAVEETGAFHAKQQRIAEILADGQVDELDEKSVPAYDDAYLRHRAMDASLHRSILTAYNRSVLAREAAR